MRVFALVGIMGSRLSRQIYRNAEFYSFVGRFGVFRVIPVTTPNVTAWDVSPTGMADAGLARGRHRS